MKNLLILVVLGAMAWYGYGKYKSISAPTATADAALAAVAPPAQPVAAPSPPVAIPAPPVATPAPSVVAPAPLVATSAVPVTTPSPAQFSCDGRTHCSQMHSCAEATYFIQHCPNTKMDGNKDGVPCERQWCR